MNIVYLIGMLLAIFFVLFGIMVDFKAPTPVDVGQLKLFFDPASVLIVVGGTLAVVIACYPKQVKSILKHFSIMLKAKAFNPEKYIDELVELAQIARKMAFWLWKKRPAPRPIPSLSRPLCSSWTPPIRIG